MRYTSIKSNDVVNGEGISVSVFLQGCPAPHCKNCFNPETWDFNGGYDLTTKVIQDIIKKLRANGIQRNLSILGGEPLCEENLQATYSLIRECRKAISNLRIYVWSRYTFEELRARKSMLTSQILSSIDYLIDGPFIEEKKDLTLKMRGSQNQRIIDVKKSLEIKQTILMEEL